MISTAGLVSLASASTSCRPNSRIPASAARVARNARHVAMKPRLAQQRIIEEFVIRCGQCEKLLGCGRKVDENLFSGVKFCEDCMQQDWEICEDKVLDFDSPVTLQCGDCGWATRKRKFLGSLE